MLDKDIKIVTIKSDDTLIFRFDMEIGGTKLAEIAKDFSRLVGVNTICTDNKCDFIILRREEETK
jgi:hypothetical protein